MSWSPELELMMRMSVSHARECPDFAALPRVRKRETNYGTVTRCQHCRAALWTGDELRKAMASPATPTAQTRRD